MDNNKGKKLTPDSEIPEISLERQEFLNSLSGHLVEAQTILQRLLRGEQLTDVDRKFLGRHLQEAVKPAIADTVAQETKTGLMSTLGEDEQEQVVEKSKDIFQIFVGSSVGGEKKQTSCWGTPGRLA